MKYILVASLITASVLIVGTRLNAHENATGIVKERMLVMEKLGKSMKALALMIRGRAFMIGEVRVLARNLADHGSANLTKLYPEGSLPA